MQKIIARVLSRLGLESAIKAKVFDSGELVIASDTPRVVVGDGITMGGRSLSPVFHKVTDLAASKDAIYKGDTIFYKNKLYTSKVSGYLQSSITLADFDVMSSEVDETTLTRDANGIILVKDGGVTLPKLDAGLAVSLEFKANKNQPNGYVGLDGAGQISSPVMIGTPIAPTASPGTNTTQVATTAFVQAGIAVLQSNKADKITGGTTDNMVKRDASGNIADSGVAVSTDGTLAANSDAKLPTEKAVKTYADTKATKVPTPTNDNIVLTDAGGNLKDSGESKLVLAQATTTQRGTSRRATSAEVIAGTDDLAHITPATAAAVYAKKAGPAHIIPVVTSDNTTNGANFLAAYAAAAALTPGGAPLSATNRACVLLLPGTYDWTATALPFVPSDNVDIAGISGNRDDVHLEGWWATGITCNYNASNVTGGSAAFHPDSTLTGVFRNCKGGDYSFAASDTSSGTFSGTATDCVGGDYSFGFAGTFSGTATGCTGGAYSFGSVTFSGTATNCTGGEGSFGSYGTFSGTATNCTGGDYSFGGYGTFSGTATNCTGGDGSFGGGGIGTFSGTATITGCVGGTNSFGGGGDFSTATSVLFKDCRLTSGSFADPGDTDVKIRRCINADLSEANFN